MWDKLKRPLKAHLSDGNANKNLDIMITQQHIHRLISALRKASVSSSPALFLLFLKHSYKTVVSLFGVLSAAWAPPRWLMSWRGDGQITNQRGTKTCRTLAPPGYKISIYRRLRVKSHHDWAEKVCRTIAACFRCSRRSSHAALKMTDL